MSASAQIGRLKKQITQARRLVTRQLKKIESGVADDSNGWVVLVELEGSLASLEQELLSFSLDPARRNVTPTRSPSLPNPQ